MRRLLPAIASSFRRKLILFNLAAVFFTAIVLFSFMMANFQSITNYALTRDSQSMEAMVSEYLQKFTQEKAESTWLQFTGAMDNLSIVGKAAQAIIDNQDKLRRVPQLFDLPLFQTRLEPHNGALGSAAADEVDVLIPPALLTSAAAHQTLQTSSLLNLLLKGAFEANHNSAFLYYVGVPPVTRAYPNVRLADALGKDVNIQFWKNYFAANVGWWQKWHTDKDLRQMAPNPVTVEAPYVDAAGQGMMVTMFYPLWDHQKNSFAGAVAVDITLAKIVETILSIRIAKSGFAFLMNSKGSIIAMPDTGFKQYTVNLKQTNQGNLSYFSGSLADSKLAPVKDLAAKILYGGKEDVGLAKVDLDGDTTTNDRHLVVWASLPAFNDSQYRQDRWRVVISVPESEIFASLSTTHEAIARESLQLSIFSILILAALLVTFSLISIQVSASTTRDLQLLAAAAEQISAKNYEVDLQFKSSDEIGQLGKVFGTMARQIKEYTIDLEGKVASRTADLVQANAQITHLNEQLADENLRLGAELGVARRLQMMVLPGEKETSAIADLDIACFMRPADEVGGDYYDVLKVGDTVFFGIGDVTGHGLSAGVIMLMAQTALMTLSQSGEKDPRRIMNVLNKVLYQNILRIGEDKNMTMAVLRYEDGEFTVVGQHESVLVCRVNGAIELIDTVDLGLPLGLEEDIRPLIATVSIRLEAGDTMVLYTDGFTEAENQFQQQYTIEGLKLSLERNHHLGSRQMIEHMTGELYEHIAGARMYDDISIVVIKQRGE